MWPVGLHSTIYLLFKFTEEQTWPNFTQQVLIKSLEYPFLNKLKVQITSWIRFQDLEEIPVDFVEAVSLEILKHQVADEPLLRHGGQELVWIRINKSFFATSISISILTSPVENLGSYSFSLIISLLSSDLRHSAISVNRQFSISNGMKLLNIG